MTSGASATAGRDTILTFYREVLAQGRLELLQTLVAADYRPHVPRFAERHAPAAGRDALHDRLRACGPVPHDVRRIIADGQFVCAHVKYAADVTLAGADIFELDDAGLIRAHWNVRQPIGGGAAQVEERFADAPGLSRGPAWPRAELKNRIRTMLAECWAKGDASLVPEYYSKNYIQHNTDMPGGYRRIHEVVETNIRAYIEATGGPFPIDLHCIGAEGDLVFIYHSLFMAGINRNEGDRSTNVDIFRVDEAGLMIEHWDILQMAGEELASPASLF